MVIQYLSVKFFKNIYIFINFNLFVYKLILIATTQLDFFPIETEVNAAGKIIQNSSFQSNSNQN